MCEQRQAVRAGLDVYSQDDAEVLVPNNSTGGLTDWCSGNMQNAADQTDPSLITGAALFPYTRAVGLYKCSGNKKPMLRGVSMNNFMGGDPTIVPDDTGTMRWFRKMTDITKPSGFFVTIDEDDETINDAYFRTRPDHIPGLSLSATTMYMNDWPATYHAGSGGLSFADGHAEVHLWKFLGRPPVGYPPGLNNNSYTGSQLIDVAYLMQIATEPYAGWK